MVVGTEPLQHNFSRGGAGVDRSGERSKSWSLTVARTILVGPDIERGAKILQILDAAGFSLEDAPIVGIFRSSDPFIRSLRKTFPKTKSVTGMRLGGRTFGDRFVEDAYAYRIS